MLGVFKVTILLIDSGLCVYVCRLFGTSTGLNFATWMAFNVPGMLINLLFAWLWLQLLFIGFKKWYMLSILLFSVITLITLSFSFLIKGPMTVQIAERTAKQPSKSWFATNTETSDRWRSTKALCSSCSFPVSYSGSSAIHSSCLVSLIIINHQHYSTYVLLLLHRYRLGQLYNCCSGGRFHGCHGHHCRPIHHPGRAKVLVSKTQTR